MNRSAFIFFALFALILSSCTTLKKDLSKVIPHQPEATDLASLQHIVNDHPAKYTWLLTDGDVDYDDGTSEITAGIAIRNRKDSVIWASANKLIEAVRLLLNKDSATILNRLQHNYSVVAVSDFAKTLGINNLNFQSVQNLLIALPPFGIDSNSKFMIMKDFYKVENQTPYYKETIEIDKQTLRMTEYRYEKNVRDFVVIKYSDFKETNDQYFPNIIDIEVHTPDKIHITLDVSGYTLLKNADVPFQIPVSYTKAQ